MPGHKIPVPLLKYQIAPRLRTLRTFMVHEKKILNFEFIADDTEDEGFIYN
jgi:hypothetical protein